MNETLTNAHTQLSWVLFAYKYALHIWLFLF